MKRLVMIAMMAVGLAGCGPEEEAIYDYGPDPKPELCVYDDPEPYVDAHVTQSQCERWVRDLCTHAAIDGLRSRIREAGIGGEYVTGADNRTGGSFIVSVPTFELLHDVLDMISEARKAEDPSAYCRDHAHPDALCPNFFVLEEC